MGEAQWLQLSAIPWYSLAAAKIYGGIVSAHKQLKSLFQVLSQRKPGPIRPTSGPYTSAPGDSLTPSMYSMTTFDEKYMTSWERARATPGLFRNPFYYELTQRRPLLGVSGAVTQFNPEHLKNKRPSSLTPTAAAAAAPAVSQPFNPDAFNFTRVNAKEALLALGDDTRVLWAACDDSETPTAGVLPSPTAVHVVFANISPIFGFGGLLVPWICEKQPQLVTERNLRIALEVAALSKRDDFRIGFNSLGAWASVNHFHWQTTYISDCFPEHRSFPIERAPRSELFAATMPGGARISVADLVGWPLGGFCVRVCGGDDNASLTTSTIAELTALLGDWLSSLVSANIAHNILIADNARTTFVIPRQHQRGGGANEGRLAVAFAESCGLAIVYTPESFATITDEEFRTTLLDFRLAEEEYARVRDEFVSAARRRSVVCDSE